MRLFKSERKSFISFKKLLLFFGFTVFFSGLFYAASAQKLNTVTGVVQDTAGTPVSGVSVFLKGSKKGVITDDNGKYSLRMSRAQANDTIVFSNVGYVLQKHAVPVSGVLDVQLTAKASQLSDVVVVGYGAQKKGALTSAVSSVQGPEIVTTKNENILNTLTGKVAGLRIVQNTSEPGSFNNSFDIRGMGSPLI
ncbi:MAG TPA: carboxypeptidase-like regulatory domain-containing protein, partial [Puia sp.]